MMSSLSWEYKITLFFSACGIVLLMLLGVEWWYGQHYRDKIIDDIFNAKKAGFDMQGIPVYASPALPIESYTDFIERPVYFESRKPVAKVVEAPPPAIEAPKPPRGEFSLILTGIVKTPQGGIKALFQNPKAATVAERNKRLGQGESFDGWTVTSIQLDKITIQADAETKEIPLLKAKPKNPVMGSNINPFAAAPNVNTPPVPIAPPPNANPFNIKH